MGAAASSRSSVFPGPGLTVTRCDSGRGPHISSDTVSPLMILLRGSSTGGPLTCLSKVNPSTNSQAGKRVKSGFYTAVHVLCSRNDAFWFAVALGPSLGRLQAAAILPNRRRPSPAVQETGFLNHTRRSLILSSPSRSPSSRTTLYRTRTRPYPWFETST